MPDHPEPYKMPWEVPGESPNKPDLIVPQQEATQDSNSNQPNQPQPKKGGHSTVTIIIVTIITFFISIILAFFVVFIIAFMPFVIASFEALSGIEIGKISFSPEVGGGLIIMLISGPFIITTLVAFAMSRPPKTQPSTSISTTGAFASTLNRKFLIPIGVVIIILLLLLGFFLP